MDAFSRNSAACNRSFLPPFLSSPFFLPCPIHKHTHTHTHTHTRQKQIPFRSYDRDFIRTEPLIYRLEEAMLHYGQGVCIYVYIWHFLSLTLQGKKQAKSEKCLVRKREGERKQGRRKKKEGEEGGEMGTCFLYMCPFPLFSLSFFFPLAPSFSLILSTCIHTLMTHCGAPKKSNYINCGHPLVI